MRLTAIRNGPKRTISTSGGLGLLQKEKIFFQSTNIYLFLVSFSSSYNKYDLVYR